jgi:hypothetical protein
MSPDHKEAYAQGLANGRTMLTLAPTFATLEGPTDLTKHTHILETGTESYCLREQSAWRA